MLLSGGVDSTVCAALVTKALGQERVIAIHIDNGFMRKNESEQVFIVYVVKLGNKELFGHPKLFLKVKCSLLLIAHYWYYKYHKGYQLILDLAQDPPKM